MRKGRLLTCNKVICLKLRRALGLGHTFLTGLDIFYVDRTQIVM